MKTVEALILTMVLSAPVMAADYPDTCAAWNRENEGGKHSFLHGWLAALETAHAVTKTDLQKRLWPEGYRVGRMRTELDTTCKAPGNRDRPIGVVITEMAGQKNGK
jgi:hypothetical protein